MARFMRLKVLGKMIDTGVVPVFYHPDIDLVRKVAAAIFAGGCPLLEFTNRGDHAWEVFSELERYCAKELPEMIVGVGSVIDPVTAGLYINCGANFVVGPVLNAEVARVCNRRNQHYRCLHRMWVEKAVYRLTSDQNRNRNQCRRVEEGCHDFSALEAVGVPYCGRTSAHAPGKDSQSQRRYICEVVSRVGQQSQATGPQASNEFDQGDSQVETRAGPQPPVQIDGFDFMVIVCHSVSAAPRTSGARTSIHRG